MSAFQDLHRNLEQKLAEFHEREDCILYASCFDANAGLFEVCHAASSPAKDFWLRGVKHLNDSRARFCWARMTLCCRMNLTTPPLLMASVCAGQKDCATNTWTWAIWSANSRSLRCVGNLPVLARKSELTKKKTLPRRVKQFEVKGQVSQYLCPPILRF